ncbi:MAG: Sec-dependent nitrous-oxide reductase [Planctomycetes bacterium]|nr:Sec-dependent nitrous-oxide reductase [Planctomycetota bacterium]
MKGNWLTWLVWGALGVLVLVLAFAPRASQAPGGGAPGAPAVAAATGQAGAIIQNRGLSPEEVEAALRTYPRPGKFDDEFFAFLSGGHAGNVLVVGLPSMRILKTIPVYSADSWQGWQTGSDESKEIVQEGYFFKDLPLTWGDLHHPKLSVTDGEYDGKWLLAADKAGGRLAVVDLRDFKTKQIVKTPNTASDHGNFFTPNSEYFVTSTFFPAPQPYGTYEPLDKYEEKYRGMITFHAFDATAGRIRLEDSWQIELPPYFQDLISAGKKDSVGWMFTNSLNTEMATGGTLEGKPAMEIGASKNEMDFVHVLNWKKAEELVKAGKTELIGGTRVLRLATAAAEGVLYFIPVSKSPHGVDVTPDGKYICCSGKLDPHVTVYSFEKIQKAIASKDFEKTDKFGVPILKYDSCREAYVELGLGPLHTEFDGQGYGYTSLFLDSAIAKWSLGGQRTKPGEEPWKLQDKLSVHYNIGHLSAPGSDTVRPYGKYLLSLNKWSVDRYPALGPLHPQNLELVDISGDKMKILYELPIGMAEPHAASIIPAEKIKAWKTYPEVGFDPRTMKKSPFGINIGQERVVREDEHLVRVFMTQVRSQFRPDILRLKEGDHVILHVTNVERARDATHGLALHGHNVNLSIDPGQTVTVEFDVKHQGVYPWYCTEFCSALHMEMTGWMLVEPKEKEVGLK